MSSAKFPVMDVSYAVNKTQYALMTGDIADPFGSAKNVLNKIESLCEACVNADIQYMYLDHDDMVILFNYMSTNQKDDKND
jgi:hypothetical protein